MTRLQTLHQLANAIFSIEQSHPLRVAIDGIDAAGKTMLADELASLIEAHERRVIRASIDGFHHPRQQRYQRGSDSPEGYYEDSFDYAALREVLLLPLGLDGNRHYRRAVFDLHRDAPLVTESEVAPSNAVLLFDGVFLLRSELDPFWDYRVFVSVDFEIALQRAILRDLPLFGSSEAIQTRYRQRYFPGQHIYLQTVRPQQYANAIVENNDLAHPILSE